jgi:hypothetical protein
MKVTKATNRIVLIVSYPPSHHARSIMRVHD